MFSFDATAGVGGNGGNQFLKGNEIHEVIFLGATYKTQPKKDGSGEWEIFEIKFQNDNGTFTHGMFGPDKTDKQKFKEYFERKCPWGTEYLPSQAEVLQVTIKHLIDAVAPEVGKLINKKDPETLDKLNTKDFKSLIEAVSEITAEAVRDGKETKIKLVKDKNGYACFPKNAIKLGVGKNEVFEKQHKEPIDFKTKVTESIVKLDDKLKAFYKQKGESYTSPIYAKIMGNFMGEKCSFSDYEMNKIKEQENAKPTPMSDVPDMLMDTPITDTGDSNIDFSDILAGM